MLYVAICDDEQYVLGTLRNLVKDFFAKNNMEIEITMFTSGEELLKYRNHIDILFLDIQMKNIDGMETAKNCASQTSKVF